MTSNAMIPRAHESDTSPSAISASVPVLHSTRLKELDDQCVYTGIIVSKVSLSLANFRLCRYVRT